MNHWTQKSLLRVHLHGTRHIRSRSTDIPGAIQIMNVCCHDRCCDQNHKRAAPQRQATHTLWQKMPKSTRSNVRSIAYLVTVLAASASVHNVNGLPTDASMAPCTRGLIEGQLEVCHAVYADCRSAVLLISTLLSQLDSVHIEDLSSWSLTSWNKRIWTASPALCCYSFSCLLDL